MDFLKEKNQSSSTIIRYLAHLINHGHKPKAIHIDRGKEFLNQKVLEWCKP